MAINFDIKSDGDDENDIHRTFALRATFHDYDVSFPTISPHQTEILRAKRRNIIINSEFATYLDHVTSLTDFVANVDEHKINYEEFARNNANTRIVNYSLDLHPEQTIDQEGVNAIRRIQIDSQSPFLFEYEKDTEQTEMELLEQMKQAELYLETKGSKKILVPVLDMKIDTEGLFKKKLETLSKKFKRINLIYRKFSFQENWLSLRTGIRKLQKENKVWYHMDCVLNRYSSNERIAHRISLYGIGIASTSTGYPFGGGKSNHPKRIHNFNPNSHRYERIEPPHEPSFAEREDRTWIESLNSEIRELSNMRNAVVRKTLYNDYIPNKPGTAGYLLFE